MENSKGKFHAVLTANSVVFTVPKKVKIESMTMEDDTKETDTKICLIQNISSIETRYPQTIFSLLYK